MKENFKFLSIGYKDYITIDDDEENKIINFVKDLCIYELGYQHCGKGEYCPCSVVHDIKKSLKEDCVKEYINFTDIYYGVDYFSKMKELGWV